MAKKFDTVTQFDTRDASDRYKFAILQIQDGGCRHLEKLENRHISAEVNAHQQRIAVTSYMQYRLRLLECYSSVTDLSRNAILTAVVHRPKYRISSSVVLLNIYEEIFRI